MTPESAIEEKEAAIIAIQKEIRQAAKKMTIS